MTPAPETPAERRLAEVADFAYGACLPADDIAAIDCGREALALLRAWKMTAEQCGMGLAEWDAAVAALLTRAQGGA